MKSQISFEGLEVVDEMKPQPVWKKYVDGTFNVHDIQTTNKVRQAAQLSLLEAKDRECLKCERQFLSYQKDIRTCDVCRRGA